MRRLSGLDAALLYGETPAMHMHASALIVLDPGPAGRFDVEVFRDVVESRLERLAPFRQRLAAVPLGLDRPVWVDDHAFDVRAHIRPLAVPRPGTPRQVAAVVGELLSHQLDRERPLWELWFIEGFEGGRVGVLGKLHHALVGGTRATALFELLFDLGPEVVMPLARPDAPVGRETERPPSPAAVARHAAGWLAAAPLRIAQASAGVARAAPRVARFARSDQWRDAVLPLQSPPTPMNGPLGPTRACAYCSIPLSDVKAIRRAFGVKVNDVVLAVCGGALRRYLDERGALPDRSLTAAVPATVPQASDESGLGNPVSALGATLATDIADPADRLARISASTRAAKTLHQALGPDMLGRLVGVVPPGLFGGMIRSLSSLRLVTRVPPPFNTVVSNLPGSPLPLYSAGAPVLGTYLFGPAIEGCGPNITVLSYRDAVDIGIVTCPDLVDDPWSIADAIPGALAELRDTAARVA